MANQLSFASLDFAAKKKRTKRDVFLGEMSAVVPWGVLESLIEPHYPKMGPQGGRRPFPLPVMLRIYCLQQWYNLSDPGAEEVLYDIQSMRAFAGLELGRDAIPDETTILNFRHLLERHDLTKAIFEGVAEHLAAKGELLRGGTIVDATLIAASPSTKNNEQKRDPEMSSSKKGNQWHFGMKAHIAPSETRNVLKPCSSARDQRLRLGMHAQGRADGTFECENSAALRAGYRPRHSQSVRAAPTTAAR
jgi:IS5 family transposase